MVVLSVCFFEHPDLLFQLGEVSPCFASIAHTGDALGTRIPFQILATAMVPKVSNSSPIHCGSCAAIFFGYVSKEQRRALEWEGQGVKFLDDIFWSFQDLKRSSQVTARSRSEWNLWTFRFVSPTLRKTNMHSQNDGLEKVTGPFKNWELLVSNR